MKILAVIPARAGSRGIPNKNIRIIGEHPLIYYSIKNALSSSLITDVIISTDSDSVRIIGEQMGARVKRRNEALCGDAVILDTVIADAIPKGEKWDYIVTMQPTSPTLKVETLDKAIQYVIEHELDTLISVTNVPHLSWSEKDGKKVPNYTERLNRQYLPPYYIETGAFVVSKAEVVTPKTRIGEKVDVYELSEDESWDVDTFDDLRSVAAVLGRESVAIYVNGNNKRGIGHIYRALEMADEFYSKPDVYYDTNQTNPKVFGVTTHNLIPVDGIHDLFNRCKTKQYSIFINDILDTSIDYMIGLRSVLPNAKLINFEDNGEGILQADLVFNALYHEGNLSKVKAGHKYYIASKLFMFYKPIKIKERVKNIFISFGGADPKNYTDRLLRIICQDEYKSLKFSVVLGRAKCNVEKLMEYNKYDNIKVFYDVSNMPEIMSSCDIGVTSRGRTGYELAFLGIPTISMAQNRREEKHGFVSNENGFSYIGLNPADEIIKGTLDMYIRMSKKSRQAYQDKLLSHDLRGGRKRVMNLINGL